MHAGDLPSLAFVGWIAAPVTSVDIIWPLAIASRHIAGNDRRAEGVASMFDVTTHQTAIEAHT